MSWSDAEDFEHKAKRAVGRPVENPFLSAEIEEEFVRRGEAMLRLYYQEEGPGTKQNFVFGPDRGMSKTLFWSIIFVYYVTEKQLRNNVQGYLNAVVLHFGPRVVSDRTSICQCVGLLNRLTANMKHVGVLEGAEGRKQRAYRAKYQTVVKLWKEVGSPRLWDDGGKAGKIDMMP